MIAYNCSLGKAICDGCNNLLTGGCLLKQSQPQQFSITHDDMVGLWERKREELMKLSKEELVELLIGKREYVGMTFWIRTEIRKENNNEHTATKNTDSGITECNNGREQKLPLCL